MTRHIPKLLALLPPDEAEGWRVKIEAEATRSRRWTKRRPRKPFS
ncbi:MAG: hypothetical protein ACXW3D_05990 [Caulobacteraceae bacterium]